MAQTTILLESGTNDLEIVEFFIDEEGLRGHYGVNVAKVVEIIRMQPTTIPVPHLQHPSVLGAFLHRDGKVIPLIDLALHLGKKNPAGAAEAKIIITEFNGITAGFKVSGVHRPHRLTWKQVEAPGEFLQRISHNTITGIVRIEKRVVFLLDMESIVADIDPSLAIHLGRLPSASGAAGEQSIYTVLHADDSSSVRFLVKQLLEKSERFKVLQASNGEEAWRMLEQMHISALAGETSIHDQIQAVISDIEMPRMDGLTLCRKIKEDPHLKTLPVVLFSSLISTSLEHKGKSVGADAQFTKPDLQTLSEKMLELIAEKNLSAH